MAMRILLCALCAVSATALPANGLLSLLDKERHAEKTAPAADEPLAVEKAHDVRERDAAAAGEPVARAAEEPNARAAGKPVEKVIYVERTNVVEKVVEKPVEKVVYVERTNVVEKVVADKKREAFWQARESNLVARSKELTEENARLAGERGVLAAEKDRLAREKAQLERECARLQLENRQLADEVGRVSVTNDWLAATNAVLQGSLADERNVRQRLERVLPKEKSRFADKEIRITSTTALYNRKERYAAFGGKVSVDDRDYQLCADRAYVFTDESNTVQRVVALENVAVTNGFRRAYGAKASYFKKTGMVILQGDGKTPAIVRDESKVDDQTVVGDKIRFWIDKEQVEVLKAHITVPVQGGGAILKKDLLGR